MKNHLAGFGLMNLPSFQVLEIAFRVFEIVERQQLFGVFIFFPLAGDEAIANAIKNTLLVPILKLFDPKQGTVLLLSTKFKVDLQNSQPMVSIHRNPPLKR